MPAPPPLRLPCAITPGDALQIQHSDALRGLHVAIENGDRSARVVIARDHAAELCGWLAATLGASGENSG